MLHAHIFGGAESKIEDKLSQRSLAGDLLVQDVWSYQEQDGVCNHEGSYQVWPGKVHCLFDEKDQGWTTGSKCVLDFRPENPQLNFQYDLIQQFRQELCIVGLKLLEIKQEA